MSSHDVLVKENDVDVAGLFNALVRNWWLILAVTVISGVGLFVVLSLISPRYLSSAQILIASKTSTAIEQIQEGGNRQVDNRIDERTVATEVEVLSSDQIAIDVINQLELYKNPEFQSDDADWKDELQSAVSEVAGGLANADAGEGDVTTKREVSGRDVALSAALRKFKKKLDVFAVDKSQVIRIEFWSKDPILARNVVASITDRYQRSKVDASRVNLEQASEFVNPRIDELRALITKERRSVAQFESDNQIFKINNGSLDNPGLLVNQELSQASTELSRLRAERSAAQAKIASIRAALNSGSSIDVIPEVLASQYIQNLRQSEVAIQAQISDLSTSLLPQHPQIKALRSQQQRYQSQILKATQDITTSLENNVALTRNAERELAQEIDQLKNDQLSVNSLLVQLDGRKKNIAAYEEELRQRLADSQQVRSRAEIPLAAANIISPASIPDEAYFPKVVPFTLAGMTASAVLTVLGILAVSLVTTVTRYHAAENEYVPHVEPDLQAVAHNQHEIEPEAEVENEPSTEKKRGLAAVKSFGFGKPQPIEQPQHPLAAFNSQNKVQPNVAQPQNDDSVIAVRYAASVLSDMGQGHIAVVSPGGDGGSRTAWILARMLSNAKHKVVLFDLAGSGETTQEMLATKDVPGIFNLISGSVTVENIIFKDRNSNTHLVPTGELFHGTPVPDMSVLGEMMDAITASYDFCIIDCGGTDLEGINLVAADDTVIVISALDADAADCTRLEAELKADGFNDILQIVPDVTDVEKESLVIA